MKGLQCTYFILSGPNILIEFFKLHQDKFLQFAKTIFSLIVKLVDLSSSVFDGGKASFDRTLTVNVLSENFFLAWIEQNLLFGLDKIQCKERFYVFIFFIVYSFYGVKTALSWEQVMKITHCHKCFYIIRALHKKLNLE